jgi:hypothetical protein
MDGESCADFDVGGDEVWRIDEFLFLWNIR